MVNRLSNLIDRNRLAAKIIRVLCSNYCPSRSYLTISYLTLSIVEAYIDSNWKQKSDIYTGPMHNVHFGYYVFLPTEQAETYLKRCVLINYSTYICLCLFGWKENMINEETVSSKL